MLKTSSDKWELLREQSLDAWQRTPTLPEKTSMGSSEDFEVLLNDRGSVDDKITFFLTCKGFGTLENFYTWLQDNPLLLPTSLRDLERGINHMLDMSILARNDEEISFQVLPSTRAVILGRRIIASDVFGVLGDIHLAIKITDSANHPLSLSVSWQHIQDRL